MCLTPILVPNPKFGNVINQSPFLEVPCRVCPECQESRKREWCFRLENELKDSSSAYFLTLTYNPDNVPLDYDCQQMVLNKKHVQDFIKRIRFYYPKSDGFNIRYFIVGEYGDKFHRPHYHAIIFNLPLPLHDATRFVERVWSFGFVQVGHCTVGGINYACKYMLKSNSRPFADAVPCFMLCSKRPPIGLTRYRRIYNEIYAKQILPYAINSFGAKVRLPDCFVNRFYPQESVRRLYYRLEKRTQASASSRSLYQSLISELSSEYDSLDRLCFAVGRRLEDSRLAKLAHSYRVRSFFDK